MSVLLITYDYTKIDPSSDPVLNIVKEYKHIQVFEGVYAIETDEKTRTVFNRIIPYLTHDVHLLIVTLIKPFVAPVMGSVSAWLFKHLPEE